MSKVKVKVLLPFVQEKKSYGFGDELSLDSNLAYKLAKKKVVEFANKKEFATLSEEIEANEKAKLEEIEEKERQVAAILAKEDLEKKRESLQAEVDSITFILDDAKSYYKKYIDLVDDLNKDEKSHTGKEEK